MKKFLIFAIFSVIFISFTSAKKEKERPVNLIIFIGDGMGADHVYAGMTWSGFTDDLPCISGYRVQHYEFSRQVYN